MEIMDTIILSIMKVYYTSKNNLVKTGKYTSKSMHNVDTIRWIFFPDLFQSVDELFQISQ